MQAIPINFSYGKSKAQRRSSEPHFYDNKSNDGHSRLVSRAIPVNRVLNRLGIAPTNPIQSNPKNTIHQTQTQTTQTTEPIQPIQPLPPQPISNHYKHIKLHTPQINTPKPNRNFYRKRTPKTPSRTRTLTRSRPHSHSVDYTITSTCISHKIKTRKNRIKSPILSSITRSKHKKRSHSFSISRTNSKAYSRRLPTHYSPSITHYSPEIDIKTPEITPPPQQLPPATHSIHTNKVIRINIRQRSRSKSLSHSVSKSKTHHRKENPDTNTLNIPASFNIAHILKMSDHENEREIKEEQETIQINNGKSLLFSSWFSANNETQTDELLNINQSEIDEAINDLNAINSSQSENENVSQNKDGSVIKERQSNPTFTMGLKPPRQYDDNNNDGKGKEEMISFRDFLAQENRKALQREIVNVENKSRRKKKIKVKNVDRFFILKGNTIKVDYGLPDGPYTLYKFVITYNHKYTAPNSINKACKSADSESTRINHNYDESPRKKTSHWSIRKRYSDFVTFNQNVIAEIKELRGKTIKLPKLPPKTFKKNFAPAFVSWRHAALLSYLNSVILIAELQSSITLLTFLGAINNHTIAYNDKFLDARMTLSVYISNYADTGDVLLFETKSYIAASLRSVTSSNYDHVALVYRDILGTHKCGKISVSGLYLIESTIDGVRTYPLKSRLKQWSLLCPQIVVRRLKLLKTGIQEKRMQNTELQSSSLNSIDKEKDIYTKYDYAVKGEEFYNLSAQFVEKVNGLDYAIWSNVFRLSDVPFEKQKSFFCSQLVTAFFKFLNLLPNNVKTNRILPGHFSDDRNNRIKLPLKNCLLLKEHLLLFKRQLPNINNAKHQNIYL